MDRLGDGPNVVVAGCPAQVVPWGGRKRGRRDAAPQAVRLIRFIEPIFGHDAD